jgi:hypothetical protein
MEMHVEKTKGMRMLRQPYPLHIMIHQKQLENVEYSNYLGSTITNDTRCTHEIKCRVAMTEAAFNKKKTFHWQIALKFEEETGKMLLVKCSFVWC